MSLTGGKGVNLLYWWAQPKKSYGADIPRPVQFCPFRLGRWERGGGIRM